MDLSSSQVRHSMFAFSALLYSYEAYYIANSKEKLIVKQPGTTYLKLHTIYIIDKFYNQSWLAFVLY